MGIINKFILDACCGPKHFWIQKNHPNVLFIDIRKENKGFVERRPNCEINPDMIADFRCLPFENKKFKLIIWDPPHMIAKNLNRCDIIKKYGGLNPITWKNDLIKGFNEIWRVLEDYGILIFKFNNYHIPFNKILNLFSAIPLFGTTTTQKKSSMTRWFCYMKIAGQPRKNKNTTLDLF